MSTRIEGKRQCHYCDDLGRQCTGETLDPDAEVLLCAKHTARLLEYAVWVQAKIASKGVDL
jgi:hypothetical protein